MDADLAAVGVEGNGGETGKRSVYHHTRNRLVGDEVGVVVQQCRRFYGDALVVEDDGGREQHVGFGNARGGELAVHDNRDLINFYDCLVAYRHFSLYRTPAPYIRALSNNPS